jgi:aldehyde:ferredoxin oxidoreductase
MMRNGYAGSILRVNLSSGEVKKEPLPDELVDNYIGGRGFVAKLLYDELPPNTDPYSAENMFLAATGQRQNPFRHQIAGHRRVCGQQYGRPFRPGFKICRI